jgi:hypothetical protein
MLGRQARRDIEVWVLPWNVLDLAPNITPPKNPTSFLGAVATRNNTNPCSWSKIKPCCLAGGYQFTVCSSTAGITLNVSCYCSERYRTHLRSFIRNRPINLVQGEHCYCIHVVPRSVSYYQRQIRVVGDLPWVVLGKRWDVVLSRLGPALSKSWHNSFLVYSCKLLLCL